MKVVFWRKINDFSYGDKAKCHSWFEEIA